MRTTDRIMSFLESSFSHPVSASLHPPTTPTAHAHMVTFQAATPIRHANPTVRHHNLASHHPIFVSPPSTVITRPSHEPGSLTPTHTAASIIVTASVSEPPVTPALYTVFASPSFRTSNSQQIAGSSSITLVTSASTTASVTASSITTPTTATSAKSSSFVYVIPNSS